MLQTTTLTQKWQMTLPKKIREVLGLLKPGTLILEIVSQKEKLIKLKESSSFLDLAGSLPKTNSRGEKLNVDKIRDYLEKHYLPR